MCEAYARSLHRVMLDPAAVAADCGLSIIPEAEAADAFVATRFGLTGPAQKAVTRAISMLTLDCAQQDVAFAVSPDDGTATPARREALIQLLETTASAETLLQYAAPQIAGHQDEFARWISAARTLGALALAALSPG